MYLCIESTMGKLMDKAGGMMGKKESGQDEREQSGYGGNSNY